MDFEMLYTAGAASAMALFLIVLAGVALYSRG